MVWGRSRVGSGTTIIIVLPLDASDVDKSPSNPIRAVSSGAGTILMAEDETALSNLFSAFLGGAGYTVLTAGSSVEAVRLAAECDDAIDLCLFDVTMPEPTGYKAYAKSSEAGAAIPVIFMTGRVDAINPVKGAHTSIGAVDKGTLLDLVATKLSALTEAGKAAFRSG